MHRWSEPPGILSNDQQSLPKEPMIIDILGKHALQKSQTWEFWNLSLKEIRSSESKTLERMADSRECFEPKLNLAVLGYSSIMYANFA